jgi:hypothetical protein
MNLLNKNKIKRAFINPSTINRHLYCCICQDVFIDPVRTQCGYFFNYLDIHFVIFVLSNGLLLRNTVQFVKRNLELER